MGGELILSTDYVGKQPKVNCPTALHRREAANGSQVVGHVSQTGTNSMFCHAEWGPLGSPSARQTSDGAGQSGQGVKRKEGERGGEKRERRGRDVDFLLSDLDRYEVLMLFDGYSQFNCKFDVNFLNRHFQIRCKLSCDMRNKI